mmetsp:Transcript_64451/g.149891  ORF Transcript_64451/g.149891 Transcript_64451/m.149891 type:complete len:369 (-) Transcript_64451:105-1211(-)
MAESIDVAVICCGAPKRGMGWYHCKQLLDQRVSRARLTDVVEPWFLGGGKDSPPAKEFAEWAGKQTGVKFHASVEDVPLVTSRKLVIICGRTADNPKLFKAAIARGFTHVYLEKPGAPTVAELEEMADYAASKKIPVFMGYNRNFSKYILAANERFASAGAGVSLTLGRNDCFNTPEALDECFERNAEGMMKNMMVHELVTLITYHGLTVASITETVANGELTRMETRRGFTDFSKVGFTIRTVAGHEFVLWGDRSNGEYAEAILKKDGAEVFKSVRPDDEILAKQKELEGACPGCMPYFYLQDAEYLELKQAVVGFIASKSDERPKGVADINTAIESVKLCDHITAYLKSVLEEPAEEGRRVKQKLQ